MTRLTQPVFIGQDGGAPSNITKGLVLTTQQLRVSAGGKTAQVVLPQNSRILTATRAYVVSGIVGSAGQALLALGKDSGLTADKYGTVVVSGQKTYDFTFSQETLSSVVGTVRAELQTLTTASAEGFTKCKTIIDLIYGTFAA